MVGYRLVRHDRKMTKRRSYCYQRTKAKGFKEDQLSRIHPGETVSIRADTLAGEVFHGHVASVAPATGATFSVLPAENATGNFTRIVQRVPVRIVLDGNASQLGRLRPGLSTTVTVDARTGG